MNIVSNAGQRLWHVQKIQGTGLCIGLDPHYDAGGALNGQFYMQFSKQRNSEVQKLRSVFVGLEQALSTIQGRTIKGADSVAFYTGLTWYFMRVIDAAWAEDIRVFKSQVAFYEGLGPAGQVILILLDRHIRRKGSEYDQFRILDAKRGDIDSTQKPYYAAYLTRLNQELVPGICGQFEFDTMTVTTWMGSDVLTPGLPYFKEGKGAIVVTRTSNPSGITLQDTAASTISEKDRVPEKQRPFFWDRQKQEELISIIGTEPLAYQVMLYETGRFCRDNGLNTDGVSPIFSVMGSTLEMDDSFRKIRGNGAIALVPGFGHQGGNFHNIESLLVRDGPLEGHWGILSSSRGHNYPWMKDYGGSGDPATLEGEMARTIGAFRKSEREAYAAAKADFPF